MVGWPSTAIQPGRSPASACSTAPNFRMVVFVMPGSVCFMCPAVRIADAHDGSNAVPCQTGTAAHSADRRGPGGLWLVPCRDQLCLALRRLQPEADEGARVLGERHVVGPQI